MKTIKFLSNIFLILNIYFAFSFINEFYNLHIRIFELNYFIKISVWWTLIIFPIINFIVYIIFFFVILVFFRSSIRNKTALKILLYINLLFSGILFFISIVVINHYADVKLFKDILY